MTSTSSLPPSVPSASSTQSCSFLRLPFELQAQILLHCDYFTLKTLHRVCKSIKRLLDDAMFDKALFRPTLKPLSREALAILAQENRSGSESNVRVHPVIEESRWSVQDMSGTIYVFNNFDDFVLDILVARNECATCPAIDRVKVIIRGYRTFSIDGIRCLIHEESAMIEHEASDGEQRRPVTMEELARSLFELEALWSVEDDDDDFGLPFPNEHDRVSAELLPDGSLVVMQEMNDYIIDDYYWSPPRDDGASEFELLAGTSFRHSTATHSSPSTLP